MRKLKLSELITHRQALARDLKDPAFRALWERSALARAVAIRLVRYRADHELSQTQLANKLGMKQPAVARLESGEKNPTWETLTRLSEKLGLEFLIDIVPPRAQSMIAGRVAGAEVVQRVRTARGRFVVAVR